MKRDYTINEIKNFYGNFIKEGVKKGLFKHEGEGIMLISVMTYCGMPLTEYNKIIFLLEKAQEIRNYDGNDPNDEMYWFSKNDNMTIMYYLIHKYYGDYKFDYESDDILMRKKFEIIR